MRQLIKGRTPRAGLVSGVGPLLCLALPVRHLPGYPFPATLLPDTNPRVQWPTPGQPPPRLPTGALSLAEASTRADQDAAFSRFENPLPFREPERRERCTRAPARVHLSRTSGSPSRHPLTLSFRRSAVSTNYSAQTTPRNHFGTLGEGPYVRRQTLPTGLA